MPATLTINKEELEAIIIASANTPDHMDDEPDLYPDPNDKIDCVIVYMRYKGKPEWANIREKLIWYNSLKHK